jgi:hypothetical protein
MVDPFHPDRARSGSDDTVTTVDSRRKTAYACAAVFGTRSLFEREAIVGPEGGACCEYVGSLGGGGESLRGCEC